MTEGATIEEMKPESTEIQLRFLLEPAAIARMKETGLGGAAMSRPVREIERSAVYFDGTGHPLSQSGITLRVEKTGRHYTQRLESRIGGLGAAALCRVWQTRLSNSAPVLSGIDDQGLRRALAGYTGDRLQPVYRAKVDRTTHLLTLKDGGEVTADLDIGEITAGSARRPISELVLRFGADARQSPFDLALQMLREEPLRIAPESLAEQGLALLSERTPESHRADKFDLSRDATVEDALSHTVQHCLDHLLANQACVLDTEDPEGIHQMRVALRRFRSALRLFRELLPEEQYTWLNEELKFFTDEMAAARDWDVFSEEIVAPAAQGVSDETPFQVLRERISTQRNRSRHRARNAVLSKRYTEFILRLSAWLAGRAWRNQPLTKEAAQLFEPIGAFAAGKLTRSNRQVSKAGRKFEALSVPERHQMRIKVKRLRYTTDFFGAVFPCKALKPYRENLASLQDALGYLNDVAVAEELVARSCQGVRGKALDHCRFAGGVIIGWHSRALADSEQRLIRNVEKFISSKPFWPGGSSIKPG